MNLNTIWVVENGFYSDYHVVGLFSTKDNADRVAALVGDSTVSEWTIDPGIEDLNAGRVPYRVMMFRDGTTKYSNKSGLDYAFEKDAGPVLDKPLLYPKGVLSGFVFARDEEHAVKIMNEIRAQLIATGKWPE